jgi:hypothetical protein
VNASGYRFAAPIKVNNNDYVARLDFNLDTQGKHTLYWRGSLADDSQTNVPQHFPTDPISGQPGQPVSTLLNNSKGMAVNYTSLLSNNLVNNFRYGYTRHSLDSSGTTGIGFSIRGLDAPRNFGARANSRVVPTNSFQDDLTWSLGSHSLQFGFAFRHIANSRTSMSRAFDSMGPNNNWQTALGRVCVLPGPGSTGCPNDAALRTLPAIVGASNPYACGSLQQRQRQLQFRSERQAASAGLASVAQIHLPGIRGILAGFVPHDPEPEPDVRSSLQLCDRAVRGERTAGQPERGSPGVV